MGTLRPNSREVDLKRRSAYEYAKLHGVSGKVHEIALHKDNLYSDDSHDYSLPKEVPVIFQQFPDIRTLRKLGWYNHEASDLPIIMFIPFHDIDGIPIKVENNVKVELVVNEPVTATEMFKVKKVAGRGYSAYYWTVNVVPLVLEKPQYDKGDLDGDGFSFLKRK